MLSSARVIILLFCSVSVKDDVDTADLENTDNFVDTADLENTDNFVDTADLENTDNFVDTDDSEDLPDPVDERSLFSWIGLDPSNPFDHDEKTCQQTVKFLLYTRNWDKMIYDSQYFENEIGEINISKPIKMIIHGWKGIKHCSYTTSMIDAYLPEYDYNVIAVDWSGHGSRSNWYPWTRNQVPKVALHVAKFLDRLSDQKGAKLENVHIIGHSLGAHIAGIAGRLVTRGKVGRITGLDPAGPLFSANDRDQRLDESSAEYVDVIHTTAGFLSLNTEIGHIDFYPNKGGKLQPGCHFDFKGSCSHRRSYYLFEESVKNPKSFPAVRCENYDLYEEKKCNESNIVYMGVYSPKAARGKYYLSTNGEVPFGKGRIY